MEHFERIVDKTKIEPVYNGYQYLIVFLVAVILNTIIRFFSIRKYTDMVQQSSSGSMGSTVYGFLPELGPYYLKISRYGPQNYIGLPDEFHKSINSWLISGVLLGTFVVLVVLIADITLHIISGYEE